MDPGIVDIYVYPFILPHPTSVSYNTHAAGAIPHSSAYSPCLHLQTLLRIPGCHIMSHTITPPPHYLILTTCTALELPNTCDGMFLSWPRKRFWQGKQVENSRLADVRRKFLLDHIFSKTHGNQSNFAHSSSLTAFSLSLQQCPIGSNCGSMSG